MRYMIIGAGGTGGMIGYKLAKAGKDVTLIARGAHLAAIREKGLTVRQVSDGSEDTVRIPAASMEDSVVSPDVIFVCVKGYSLNSTYEYIRNISRESTIVIPVLNIFGTGAKMQEVLPQLLVTDGCIYVSANILEPGVLISHAPICRILYGLRDPEEARAAGREPKALYDIAEDLQESGIDGIYTDFIRRDALQKFMYVSPVGAAGLYYGCTAGDFLKEGKESFLYTLNRSRD